MGIRHVLPPRYVPEECKTELNNEWLKQGQVFLEDDEWLEPEEATAVCQKWFQQFAVRNSAGTLLMPARVKYPGKAWILAEGKKVKGNVVTGAGGGAGAGAPGAKAGPLSQVKDYAVRLRGGEFRLIGLDAESAKVSDVPLPGPSKPEEDIMYSIVSVEGEHYFTTGGDSDLISCYDWTMEHTTKTTPPNTLPGLSPRTDSSRIAI